MIRSRADSSSRSVPFVRRLGAEEGRSAIGATESVRAAAESQIPRSAWIEPLEVRALLSGLTVQSIKDVNSVESYPADLTPAGSNLFYLVEDQLGHRAWTWW